MALVVDRVDFFDSGCSFFFGLTQNKKTGVGVHKNHKIPGWNKRAKTRRTSQCHLSTTKPSKKPPQKKQMKQYALREKLRHYSSSALCGPGGGSTAPLGATSILEDIGNIGILDGGTEVFFFLVFLLFLFFYSFSSFFFLYPQILPRMPHPRSRLRPTWPPPAVRVSFSSIFFEYLFRVSSFMSGRGGRRCFFFFFSRTRTGVAMATEPSRDPLSILGARPPGRNRYLRIDS